MFLVRIDQASTYAALIPTLPLGMIRKDRKGLGHKTWGACRGRGCNWPVTGSVYVLCVCAVGGSVGMVCVYGVHKCSEFVWHVYTVWPIVL